jgi:hypothetical protein
MRSRSDPTLRRLAAIRQLFATIRHLFAVIRQLSAAIRQSGRENLYLLRRTERDMEDRSGGDNSRYAAASQDWQLPGHPNTVTGR